MKATIIDNLTTIRESVNQALNALDLQTFQELSDALKRNEFYIYYEPVVNIKSDGYEVIGIEALLRWKQPSGKIVRPIDFIPKAEATGLIVEIGRWVLESACHHARYLNILGYPISTSVNLSPKQITNKLTAEIREIIKNTGLHPSKLSLEITENLPIQSMAESVRILEKIADLGVKIILDDFGIGYSSMEYLRLLPISAVKIDKSFLVSGTKNLAIMKAIINLCNDLKIDVITEGVETLEQMDFLRKIGCNLAQGFLFCEPGAYYNVKNQ